VRREDDFSVAAPGRPPILTVADTPPERPGGSSWQPYAIADRYAVPAWGWRKQNMPPDDANEQVRIINGGMQG